VTLEDLVAVLGRRDVAALGAVLDPDVVLVSDGGGQVVTPLRPVRGAGAVARLVAGLVTADSLLSTASVNTRPGVVVRRDGRACAVIVPVLEGSAVTHVWVVLNPDKLERWHRVPG
jgi:RNA polymerase sigma-70 factor (ECF subfamily)